MSQPDKRVLSESEQRAKKRYDFAMKNGWTKATFEEEMDGPSAYEAYKAIMSKMSYLQYRKVVGNGGSVPHPDQKGKP